MRGGAKNSDFIEAIDCNNVKDKRIRSRKRIIVLFNPPFSDHVSTNIGREFLKLLDKHFPPNHRLRKICNRSTIKISYCCMPNMEAIISRHNKRLTNHNVTEQQPTATTCNCRQKNDSPLNGRCLERSLVYSASVSCPGSNTMNARITVCVERTSKRSTITILIHLGTKKKLMTRSFQNIFGNASVTIWTSQLTGTLRC